MTECTFCSIVAGNSSAQRVYEDETTLAVLDTEPATRGHTLVIPKLHRGTITEMQESLAGQVFKTVHRVASALEAAYRLDGISIHQSNGDAAGQDVGHAHVHVIPRYDDDDVDLEWASQPVEPSTRETVATTIRSKLASQ